MDETPSPPRLEDIISFVWEQQSSFLSNKDKKSLRYVSNAVRRAIDAKVTSASCKGRELELFRHWKAVKNLKFLKVDLHDFGHFLRPRNKMDRDRSSLDYAEILLSLPLEHLEHLIILQVPHEVVEILPKGNWPNLKALQLKCGVYKGEDVAASTWDPVFDQFKHSNWPLTALQVDIRATGQVPAAVSIVKPFKTLQELHLWCDITPESASELATFDLPELESLKLSAKDDLYGQGVAEILAGAEWPNLRELTLSRVIIPEKRLDGIFTRLMSLELVKSVETPEQLSSLLESLNGGPLVELKIEESTSEALSGLKIANLPHLRNLMLTRIECPRNSMFSAPVPGEENRYRHEQGDDNGINAIFEGNLPLLRLLRISFDGGHHMLNWKVAPYGLRKSAVLPSLEKLLIAYVKIGTQCQKFLAATVLPRLNLLNLHCTNMIPFEGMELPNLQFLTLTDIINKVPRTYSTNPLVHRPTFTNWLMAEIFSAQLPGLQKFHVEIFDFYQSYHNKHDNEWSELPESVSVDLQNPAAVLPALYVLRLIGFDISTKIMKFLGANLLVKLEELDLKDCKCWDNPMRLQGGLEEALKMIPETSRPKWMQKPDAVRRILFPARFSEDE